METQTQTQDLRKFNGYQAILHGIKERYFFPDIDKALSAVKSKTVQLDAYYPQYLSILCVPHSLLTEEQKLFMDNFHRLSREENCVNTMRGEAGCPRASGGMLHLEKVGIVPKNIQSKVDMFRKRLSDLNIQFSIVGLGGGGNNALRIFDKCSYTVDACDYDAIEVHNLPRLNLSRAATYKATAVHKYYGKFDVNRPRARTLVYSGVDYGDRQALTNNKNVMYVQAGFGGDRCIVCTNPENVEVFTGDSYGEINTHTMMLNAFRGVALFLDWFLALSDEEINDNFMKSTIVADFSILEDEKVTETLFLEPIVKRPRVPKFVDYKGLRVPISDVIHHIWIESTFSSIVASLQVSTYGFDYIPMYKVSELDYENIIDLTDTLYGRYTVDYNEDTHAFKNFETELAVCTLQEIVLEAAYRLNTMRDTFLGVICSVDDTTRINILHPLTAAKVLKHLDRDKKYNFWLYTVAQGLQGQEYTNYQTNRLNTFVTTALASPQGEDVENVVIGDIDSHTGEMYGACTTYTGSYLLGIDTILAEDGMEYLPYYGYLVGSMEGAVFNFTDYNTGNVERTYICTGDASPSLFSSRHRHRTANPHSTYFDSFIPTNEFGGAYYAMDTSLNMYFDALGLNTEVDDV